ncbi:SDR family NAD(P)-dependent oxidoreductase [Amycolatopsis sp. NPDC101161]|uniref:SDR family NAD(P)-dependent oxidoreductase n=1 Tax=Amycolatopsis sp. NPDC101161 TaxID=3363940 RepID=UPI003802B59F
MNERELAGRIVVVFGAGSSGTGISNGEAAALAYAEAGATVAAVDRDPTEADRVAKEIITAGGTALPVTADVTAEADVRNAIARIVAALGVPHVLHNNVGASIVGEITELDLDAWNRGVAINLTSAYLTCRHTIPLMKQAGRGAIVNVSSLSAIRDTGYVYPVYNAAKAGLNQLTVSLALTYARNGIRANAVLPGVIETPMVSQQLTSDPAELAARHELSPTGRMGTPQDVANAAVFLASDRAAYINGVCLPVDGGLSSRCG